MNLEKEIDGIEQMESLNLTLDNGQMKMWCLVHVVTHESNLHKYINIISTNIWTPSVISVYYANLRTLHKQNTAHLLVNRTLIR